MAMSIGITIYKFNQHYIMCETFVRYLDVFPGPGVQHIGICTDDIQRSVSILSNNGVTFRKPPPAYYNLVFYNALFI